MGKNADYALRSHKLQRFGKGASLWGCCSCEMWAWLGTYEMPKGRLAKLRAAHAAHVELVQPRHEKPYEFPSPEECLAELIRTQNDSSGEDR